MSTCVGAWLKQASGLLVHSDSARLDAELLCAHVLGRDRSFLFAWPEHVLNEVSLTVLDGMLKRRIAGEPMAYILGEREFWSLNFYCDRSTLIPRPDTEVLVASALQVLPEGPCTVLDLGTGTGAVALAIASERRDAAVTAVDDSPEALALAQRNIHRHQLHTVTLVRSDWFVDLRGKFHCIVSNPPYIDGDDPHLRQGDVRFEPHSALVAANHGMLCLQVIVAQAPDYLHDGGWLCVEHGWQQAEAVRLLFQQHHFLGVESVCDYAGHERVTRGYFDERR